MHSDEDLIVDRYKFIDRNFNSPVVDSDDIGYPGDTPSEKAAFADFMVDGRFFDVGATQFVTGYDRMTWRGQGS